MKRTIVLASASKRRSQILSSCGIKHRVAISHISELEGPHNASWLVVHNATEKAKEIASRYEKAIIIGADTIVSLNGKLIGKPKNKEEAKRFLRRFSAKRLEVFTGLCLIDTTTGKSAKGFEKSALFVCRISDRERRRFFRSLGPYDKAGGFSIEGVGSMLFDDIRGSYFNILGLPMIKLRKLFFKIKMDITDFICVPR